MLKLMQADQKGGGEAQYKDTVTSSMKATTFTDLKQIYKFKVRNTACLYVKEAKFDIYAQNAIIKHNIQDL